MADDKKIIIIPGRDDTGKSGFVIPSLTDVLNLRAKKLSPEETVRLLKSEPSPGALLPDTRPEIITPGNTIIHATAANTAGLGLKGVGPLSGVIEKHFPRGDAPEGKIITDPAATAAMMKELRHRTQGR